MVGVVSVGRSVIGQNGIWDTVMAGMVIVVVLVYVFPPELDQTIVGYSGQGITDVNPSASGGRMITAGGRA